MNLTLNYNKASSILLICFSGFYLTGILAVSPLYLTFIIAFVTLITGNIIKQNTSLHRLSFPVLLYMGYLILSQSLIKPNISSFINILFSLIYLILVLNTVKHLDKDLIARYSRYFILFTILIIFIETLWRLTHPDFSPDGTSQDYREVEGLLFYAYKHTSIMFQDSNFVGTYALCGYFLYQYLLSRKFVRSKMPLIILGVLIILTLSRSAILTVPIAYILIHVSSRNSSLVTRTLALIALISGVLVLLAKMASDVSFLSKFEIIELSISHLKESSLSEILFGIGYGNTVNYFGIGAHNLFVTHLIESGIIGLLLFLIVNLMFIKGSNRYSLYLTFPLFISGFSLAGHALSFYYSCLVIIYILEKKNGENFSADAHVQRGTVR